MDRKQAIQQAKRVVVKVGSRLILGNDDTPDTARIQALIDNLAAVVDTGREVILVSSGAIAVGMNVMETEKRPKHIAQLQALAALGQGKLMSMYEEASRNRGFHCAQILLSLDDVKYRARHLNVINCLNALLGSGVLPVINENDAVSVDEICFGDNDRLAALVGTMARADLTILLTTVDGFHEREDGELKPEPVSVIHTVDDRIRSMAGGTDGNQFSTGGMTSKLQAAETVMSAGECMMIASGQDFSILQRIFKGEEVGTLFLPKASQLSGSKRYLAFFAEPSGTITIDDGAKSALVNQGKSLLPSGIVRVEGEFEKGATVQVVDNEGTPVAIGKSNYPSTKLLRIAGLRSDEIHRMLDREDHYDEAIHRNNMVIL